MTSNKLNWSPTRICLRPDARDMAAVAVDIYARTCRTGFEEPGFCVWNVGSQFDSHAFRALMVKLKVALSAIHEATTGNALGYLSLARFDQQSSTKPHLDGGPEECFLMLGYEPSQVDSELAIADYAKCACDLRLTPKEFLAKHNPMFQAGQDLLIPYTTRIPCFSPTDFQIVCINNSFAPYSPERPMWQGTLHTATIITPDDSQRRIINSTMIASISKGEREIISAAEQQDFIHTTVVRRSGYDKAHLRDDE